MATSRSSGNFLRILPQELNRNNLEDAETENEDIDVIAVGMVGLGKMGLSHQSIINMHPNVELAAVCDSTGFLLDVLNKYTGVRTFSDFDEMLDTAKLDAVIISTPSRLHAAMVRRALEHDVHVFCEKPFVLDAAEGRELASLAADRGLVNQVGYHCRFVAAFQEAKRLLDAGAIGEVTHALAESYGPVVLKPSGSTWRTKRSEGGGCLYDYAAHPINLLTWYFGAPKAVAGTVINNIFSKETDDEVYSTFYFPNGSTAQLSVNWTDESCRKMTTKVTIWGTAGKIYVDRQEIQVYLRNASSLPSGYKKGWNVHYTTELTAPVQFYLRGEEYSSQLDYFISCIEDRKLASANSFESAALTDSVISAMKRDAEQGARHEIERTEVAEPVVTKSPWWRRWLTPWVGRGKS